MNKEPNKIQKNQLLIAKDIGYLSKETFDRIARQSVAANRLLTGLLKATRLRKYES